MALAELLPRWPSGILAIQAMLLPGVLVKVPETDPEMDPERVQLRAEQMFLETGIA
jgi:hypothetical protein